MTSTRTQTNMKRLFAVIVILFGIILFFSMRNGKALFGSGEPKTETVIKHDTVWIVKKDTVVKQVKMVKVLPGDTIYLKDTKYIPDTNYAKLKIQFQTLVKEHINRKIYWDSIKIDNFGYVYVQDTVRLNALGKRIYKYDYKIPVVTTTVTTTKPLPPKVQFYVGGGLTGNTTTVLSTAQVGLLIKNKKDLLYGIITSVDTDGNLSYGATLYYKIK